MCHILVVASNNQIAYNKNMHSDVEEKFRKFIEEQMQLMEQAMGPLALKTKPQFGADDAAYFQWLNMAYQFKKAAPHLTEEQLSPEALAIPHF
jgi:hypothetical protein